MVQGRYFSLTYSMAPYLKRGVTELNFSKVLLSYGLCYPYVCPSICRTLLDLEFMTNRMPLLHFLQISLLFGTQIVGVVIKDLSSHQDFYNHANGIVELSKATDATDIRSVGIYQNSSIELFFTCHVVCVTVSGIYLWQYILLVLGQLDASQNHFGTENLN